jgi:menaquinone-dependent protoporphyrinogen IX oxidase
MQKLLIVYATWTRATRSIADELRNPTVQLAVFRAAQVEDAGPYQGVIVCASVHMGLFPGEIKRFIQSNRKILTKVPVAYCIVCLAVTEDTDENRKATQSYVHKLRQLAPEIVPVVDVALFGGVVLADTPEFRRLCPLLRMPVRAMAAQPDHRDWEAIRGWALGLKSKIIVEEI